MSRIKAYIATRLFPLQIKISKKEYEAGKASMPENEFKQKYVTNASNLGPKNYFNIVSETPKDDDFDTLLLYKLFEQQSTQHSTDTALMRRMIELQEEATKRLYTISTIMVVFTIISIAAAIISLFTVF